MSFVRGTCAVLTLVVAAACPGPVLVSSGPTVTMEIGPTPLSVGTARVVVTLSDPSGHPVPGATLRLEGNMTHPGMVPVFSDGRETLPGRYEADLELTMGGDWIVTVEGRLAGGTSFTHAVPVPGVRSN